MKISFCTVSMNRLHHLKQTLLKNIIGNISRYTDVEVEFVVLDYNSTDGLEDWIRKNLYQFIESGILNFYRTTTPKYFDRSHSRNLAFKVAKGDIICNIDADNYIGDSFYMYVYNTIVENPRSFITPAFNKRDIMGKVCMTKKDFLLCGGFNEEMKGYGFEDIELYARLVQVGLSHCIISEQTFLNVIHHSHEERYANEFVGKNIKSIYISHINPWTSILLYLYKNNLFDYGIIVNNKILTKSYIFINTEPSKPEVDQFSRFTESENKISLISNWQSGYYRVQDGMLSFYKNDTLFIKFFLQEGVLYNISNKERFYSIKDKSLEKALLVLKTELSNRKVLSETIGSAHRIINANGFGIGKVKKNFKDIVFSL